MRATSTDHPTDYTLLGPTDLVPMAALATTGGPTHPDGRTLVVNEPPDNPNAVDLLILPTADWVPFSEVPQVPLADVTYAY